MSCYTIHHHSRHPLLIMITLYRVYFRTSDNTYGELPCYSTSAAQAVEDLRTMLFDVARVESVFPRV